MTLISNLLFWWLLSLLELEIGADGTKGDEALAILLEELKNENIQTRINAVRRIQTIAKAMGPEKTRSKLLAVIQGACVCVACW